MKTLDKSIARNVKTSHSRVRLLLTLAGVLTAVLCSFALQNDVLRSKRINPEVFHLQKFSSLLTEGFVGEVKAWM